MFRTPHLPQPAQGRPGEVVTLKVINGIEDQGAKGKVRPGILVERVDGHWRSIPLTSQSCYFTTGMPRLVLPEWRELGLYEPSYLWSPRPCDVSAIDIFNHIGWVNETTLTMLQSQCRLTPIQVAAMRTAAAEINEWDTRLVG